MGVCRPVSPAQPSLPASGVSRLSASRVHGCSAARGPAEGIGAAVKAAALNLAPPQVGHTWRGVGGPCGMGPGGWGGGLETQSWVRQPWVMSGPCTGHVGYGVGAGMEGEARHEKITEGGQGRWRARWSQCGWSADGGGTPSPVPTQVWALAVWHFRQSTWPSRGKQPLSSASMDSGFPQSWEEGRRVRRREGRCAPRPPHIPPPSN